MKNIPTKKSSSFTNKTVVAVADSQTNLISGTEETLVIETHTTSSLTELIDLRNRVNSTIQSVIDTSDADRDSKVARIQAQVAAYDTMISDSKTLGILEDSEVVV